MGRPRTLLRAVILPALLAAGLSGCGFRHFTFDVDPLRSAEVRTNAFATIVAVRDMREFAADPRDPSTPSLFDATQLGDAAITARAIARRRDPNGMARGDLLLPEGKTVADLVRAVAVKALRDEGYTVVDAASPDAAAALPLSLDIEQFWQWNGPSGLGIQIEFRTVVRMAGPGLVGGDRVTATSYGRYESWIVYPEDRRDLYRRGMEELAEDMKRRIKLASAAAASPLPSPASAMPAASRAEAAPAAAPPQGYDGSWQVAGVPSVTAAASGGTQCNGYSLKLTVRGDKLEATVPAGRGTARVIGTIAPDGKFATTTGPFGVSVSGRFQGDLVDVLFNTPACPKSPGTGHRIS